MTRRQVVQIDETKCDGCGQCATACAEGAIQIIDGKARLIGDIYCDGLGACLGTCPRDAITVVDREAQPFSEAAVQARRAQIAAPANRPSVFHACPGTATIEFPMPFPTLGAAAAEAKGQPSPLDNGAAPLSHWPVQLHLVSPAAPFLQGADLFLVADCVPFACSDFHSHILRRRPVVVGCPKLDDGQAYVEKLAEIFQQNALKSLTVVHMEVPCCTNLQRIAAAALRLSGATVPLEEITIFRDGRMSQPAPSAP